MKTLKIEKNVWELLTIEKTLGQYKTYSQTISKLLEHWINTKEFKPNENKK